VLARVEIINKLHIKGFKRHIPHIFLDTLAEIFTAYFDSRYPTTPTHPSMAMAYTARLLIGLPMFLRGYIAGDWTQALSELGVDHPA
jgi:hypothetical protein